MSGESSNPCETWRVFIAVELPLELRHLIRLHVDRLRDSLPDVRASWSREDNLHLTLKFLGDIPIADVEKLSRATKHTANAFTPFEIAIEDCGAFPPNGQPRVLWIGIDDPSCKLRELQQRLEAECATEDFAREQRPFHPHLTIARLRKPNGSRQLASLHKEIGFDRVIVQVSGLAVIRSELLREGSRHTAIARHEFRSI